MKRPLSVVLALTVAVLVGCGGEPEMVGNPPLPESVGGPPSTGDVTAMEPAKAATAAVDAAVAAGGIRLRTDVRGGRVDLRLSPGRAVGVVFSGETRVDVRRVGAAVYVKSVPTYWERTPLASSAATIGTRWVRISRADDRDGGLLVMTDFEQYLGLSIDPGRWDSWADRKTIRGVRAVGLRNKEQPASTLYVAASGPPYPLLLASSTDTSSWEFLDVGKPAETGVPAGAIDGDKLPAERPL